MRGLAIFGLVVFVGVCLSDAAEIGTPRNWHWFKVGRDGRPSVSDTSLGDTLIRTIELLNELDLAERDAPTYNDPKSTGINPSDNGYGNNDGNGAIDNGYGRSGSLGNTGGSARSYEARRRQAELSELLQVLKGRRRNMD